MGRLTPWEHPPAWVDDPDDYPESPEAAQLLKQKPRSPDRWRHKTPRRRTLLLITS
jgi:hypothetical protein